MYNNQKQGFSVRDILIQVLFIILFIFILVWLFPTKPSVNKQYDSINNKLDILTGTMFNSNITTMKDAAISYYTTERLPQTVGATERMTLKSMLDEKLLVEFKDGNGKSCNVNSSYVEVTKLDEEYQMKVNLSCTDNDAYIIVHLGCYDYCMATGVCQKVETPTITVNKVQSQTCQYEYKKVINGSWGDFGNWSSWTTSKVDETDYRKVETKTEVSIVQGEAKVDYRTELINAIPILSDPYCPAGYTKTADGKSCITKLQSIKTAGCPAGYTLNANGTCTGKINSTTYYKRTACPSGYYLSGTECYKQTSINITETPTCKTTGYKYNSTTHKCEGITTYEKGDYVATLILSSVPETTKDYFYDKTEVKVIIDPDCYDECTNNIKYQVKKYKTIVKTPTETPICATSGYSFNGSTCVKATTNLIHEPATCPTGTKTVNGQCIETVSKSKTVTATCSTGYTLNGNKCYGIKDYTTGLLTTTSYSCPSPTDEKGNYTLVNESKCTRTIQKITYDNIEQKVLYYRYKERNYISGDVKYTWSSSQNDTSLISQGYSLTGNKKCSK